MKKNFFPSKNNGKENMKNEINIKKLKIIGYKHLSKDDFCDPFYFNKVEIKKHNNIIQRKIRLFNYVEVEDKNKNLKIFDGEKFNSYKNINNKNKKNNNPNNYYLNRKFATVIFDRIHKLNLACLKNCNKSVINKLYFCTKINTNKKEKKKSKEMNKSLDKSFLINKNTYEKLYLQRLQLKQSSSIINIKQENKKDKSESNQYKSQSKNKSLNHNQNNNEKYFPNLSVLYNKNIPRKQKSNFRQIDKGIRESETKKQGKKEMLNNPLNNKNFRNKNTDFILPKLKDFDKNNNDITYNDIKLK